METTYLHVVSILEGGDGTCLDEELIDTDKTADVTARHILNGLDVTAHHEDGPLDGLLVQVLLLAGHEVGAHNAALETGGNLSGEDTAEGVETALVRSGHHLGDVHHERTIGVAGLHGHGRLIVSGAFVQHLSPDKTNKMNAIWSNVKIRPFKYGFDCQSWLGLKLSVRKRS